MAVETGRPQADQVVLLDVSWNAYQALVESLGENKRARLTYDGETLEIMSPGSKHERLADRLGDLVSAVVVEWTFNIEGTGATTFQQPGERGFEADKSYYIENLHRVRDVNNIDLSIDPPPDLVVEIDIANIRSNKFSSYAHIGIPEFWRYRNDRLQAFALSDGAYVAIDVSRVIPGLPLSRVQALLATSDSRLEMLTAWRQWLHDNRRLHVIAIGEAN